MTNNEQDNLRQSIEALQDFWSNHEDYDIREKAREYIELYQSNGNSDHFSWVHPEDAPYIKENGCNAVRWGIPNQIIGDIEKAKFVIGLLNPGTQIETEASNQCGNITEYVTAEQAEENNTGVDNVSFESKEYSEDPNFYLDHVISNENIMSQELKKLYKIFKQDSSVFFTINKKGKTIYNEEMIEKAAYYLFAYYSKAFMNFQYNDKHKVVKSINGGIGDCMDYYYDLFEKMERAKAIVKEKNLNYDVEQAFNQAVERMSICNVEIFPYRSNGRKDIKIEDKNSIKDLSSSRYISELVIDKLMYDKTSVAIFRNFSAWWEGLLESTLQNRNMELDGCLKQSIYYLINPRKGTLSKRNVVPYDSSPKTCQEGESQRAADTIVEALLSELKIKSYVNELDKIIAENE